jgi:protein involved in polysaccharide export with SLBB domain
MRKLMHAKESAKEQFANEMEATSQAMAELEQREQEKAHLQRAIEQYQEFHSQLENAKHKNQLTSLPGKTAAPADDNTVTGTYSTNSVEGEPGRIIAVPQPANPFQRAAGDGDKIASHDVIRIQVANAFADQPIDGNYVVEPMGTVALGPGYGRVKVAGLSILEAEDAIKDHLAKMIENPEVQATVYEKRETGGDLAGHLSADSAIVDMDLLKQQLQLERDAYRIKADALREKSASKRKQLERIAQEKPKNISTSDISEARAEALIMDADAKLSEAKSLELEMRLKSINREAGGPSRASSPLGGSASSATEGVLQPGDRIEVLLTTDAAVNGERTVYVLDDAGQIQLRPDLKPTEVAGVDPKRAETIIASALKRGRDQVIVRRVAGE